jgi:hypothetical protein
LNRAYNQALQRYNRNITGLNTAGGTNSAATGSTNRATTDATRRQQLSRNDGATATGRNRANNRIANRTAGGRDDFAEGDSTATAQNNAAISQNPDGSTNVEGAAGFQQDQFSEFQNQFNTDFNGVLDTTFTDPAMRERYNQLNWQYQGLGAFNDPMVQQRLNLTPQQQQRLQTLNAQWRQQLQALQTQNRRGLTQQDFAALRARFMNQLDTVLTPEQQQQWTALIGDAYDFPYSAYQTPAGSQVQSRSVNPGASAGSGTSSAVRTPPDGQPALEPHRTTGSSARGTSNTRGAGTGTTR